MTEAERIASIREASTKIIDLRSKGYEGLASLLYARELRLAGAHRTHSVNAALCFMELAAHIPANRLPEERRRLQS